MNPNLSQQHYPDRLHQLLNDINSFDEVPIGGNTNKFAVAEYAEGEYQQPIQSTTNLTLQQKLHSKTVKIKLQGLEELKKALGNQQNNSQQIQLQLSKILKQNNPACLQKALQCAEKWMQLGRSWGQKQIKQIIQNGSINGKGNTKKLASDLVFKAFETRPQQVEKTITELGLKTKVPKILGGYISVISQLLQQFGIKDLKYLKPYIPSVVQIMNNQKLPVIKSEGMNLLKNGLKWLGKDFLWPLFNDLKENMKKQLQSFWETHDKKQVMKANRQKNTPNVNICGNLPNKSKTKANQKVQNQVAFGGTGLDIYQISDPIQIFAKFDEKWSETVLETQKWNSKTTLLQEIITKASVPKIANSEHRHITQMIKRLLNDSNFNVVLSALRLVGALAKGLRKNFNHSAKVLFPYIIPKFRDKKTQMIDQTFNTLNNLYYCMSIDQVSEDIKAGLKDKAAGMKNSIIKWMNSYIERKNSQNNSSGSERIVQFFKSSSIISIFQSLLNDPNAEVRDSTAKLVCKVRAVYGDGLFKNIDKNISNKQILQKLNEGLQNNQQALAKSRGKDTSNKKNNLSKSKSKNTKQDNQQIATNSCSYKTNGKGDTVDITDQLNKNMKKLNDNSNWQNRKQSAEKLIKYFSQLENSNARITSSILYDFLGILKSRISDPNKQLVKIFVSLVGDVFRLLNQKQAKIQAKCFIQELIEVFSDKNQSNRKQIYKALDRIAFAVGFEIAITYFGQLLTQQTSNNSPNSQMGSTTKQYTLEYLNNSQYFVNRVDQIQGTSNLKQLKQFPKIILSGLCDKNKDLRAISQKLFKLFYQKTGTEIFRNFVNSKQQKSMFKTDLIAFLDKYQGLNAVQQPSMMSNMSNGSFLSANNLRQIQSHLKRSPSINKSKISCIQQAGNSQKIKKKISNLSSLNNSRSKAKIPSILLGCQQNKDATSNSSFILKSDAYPIKRIQNGQQFASIEILTNQRVQRQQAANRYRNNGNNHPITEQFQIQASLSRLVHYQQLFMKMFSYDYTKNLQAANKFIKMCRDIAQTNSIRQISDLLIKWVIIKLYGGNVAALPLTELICPILSILQKKKVAWTDYDIDMLIYLSRQYLFASFYDGNQNIETIKNIFKMAIALSSGERIVKKILGQFKSQISQYHRHLSTYKRQGVSSVKYYKRMLTLICGFLVDYFSNDGILGEAASIPQLSQDVYFVTLLANKFHEGVLKQFGFKFQTYTSHSNFNDTAINLQRSFYNAQKNPSLISPRNASPGLAFFGAKTKNESKDKKITPQKTNQNPIVILNQPKYPPPSPSLINKTRLGTQSVFQQTTISQNSTSKKQPLINCIYRNVGIQPSSNRYQIDLSSYNQPSPHNPLGSNLLRLFPYSQSTVHFFSTLFQPQNQSSDKIATELSMNCNVIYGYLFNTLIKMMDLAVRETQGPERVSTFTSLVQHAIKCTSIYKNLSQNIIEKSIRYIIDQLVYEDQNRTNIQSKLRYRGFNDFKSDVFVKGINGVMLRILDNSYPLLLVNTLLLNLMQVLTDCKIILEQNQNMHNINKGKKIGLIIRCFLRVSNSYFNQNQQKQKETQVYNVQQDPSCLKTHHIHKFILLAKQYIQIMQIPDLIQFESREQKNMKSQKQSGNATIQNNQESVVFSICKIFRILHRKNLLIKNYDIIKKQKTHFKDQRVLSEFVSSVAGVSFCDTNNLLSNQHEITYQLPSSSAHIDEQLKKIIQMLSKSKTFSEGVKLLKQYVQQSNGRFDYKNAFTKMNFEAAFIEKVNDQMGKLNILSSQGSSRSLNPDIQNKLERLKMKLEGINNQHSRSIAPKDMNEIQKGPLLKGNYINSVSNGQKVIQINVQRTRDLSSKSIEQPHFSQQNDLKKRIQQMKNKVNMSTANKMR